MSLLNTVAVLIGLAAFFACVNERFIRLPSESSSGFSRM